MGARILVVDDEQGVREALRQVLDYEGHEVRVAASGGEAITIYPDFHPHLVFLDVKMAGLDGLETLARLRALDERAQVVMISGHGTVATAVQATQRGAFDFLEKPLDTDRLLVTVRNALSRTELLQENERLRESVDARYAMVGGSTALKAVLETIEKVGPSGARVLITGENGSGKELVARAIHENSARRDGPFVEVNCAAIPGELIESELFGHVKGSFTGAVGDHAGKFELADGGTLFLDEIGDMSAAAQAKVLRVLEEGLVTRIGGSRPMAVDVRVLAATNKQLDEEIEAGRFREDLFYRLNVVPIEVPPLRDRIEDIPDLVEHFVARLGARGGMPSRRFLPDAIGALQERPWPGNIRELRNAVERLLILAPRREIVAGDVERLLPDGGRTTAHPVPGGGTFEEFRQHAEREFLVGKLRQFHWNVAETARALDMPRSNLYKKIEKYGLSREEG
jgi:two-component system nitrogen regulation response regulator NtrX